MEVIKMDTIITINGIEYIQKVEYDKAKKDVDNIRQLVASSIADLSDFLGNQSVAQSVSQLNDGANGDVRSKRNEQLKIRLAGQKEYKIVRMDENGNFFGKRNRKLNFTIKDVISIQKIYGSKTTKDDIRAMSKKFDLPVDTIHRIIYNIDKNIFTEYIKEYLSSVNDIEIKHKDAEFQNNHQKRKELLGFA
jgi:hypothetical protein